MNKKILILIDGNAVMHRAYHALPPLTTKKGELVNAVYGFTSTLLNVIGKFNPTYIAATFDLAKPTFRHKEFKAYKATRVKAPDEFYNQIPRVKEVVRALNIPIYEKEGYEADDVIGTIAKQAEKNHKDLEIIIVTGDLDTLQLVDPQTEVYTMRRGMSDSVLYDEEGVQKRYNLEPSQLSDLKGLCGDASDNIPGVSGIGEKTAAELLKTHKTLEKVYASISKIKPSLREKLERDRMQAFLSKKLGTIEKNVPISFDIDTSRTRDFDRKKVIAFFQELNFYSLLKRIPGSEAPETSQKAALEKSGVKDFKYAAVDEGNFSAFWQDFKDQKEFSLYAGDSGISFSWKKGRAVFVSYQIAGFSAIKKIMEDKKVQKIGYDLKSSYKSLYVQGIHLSGMSFDAMLAAYLLDPGSKIELEKIILTELGEELSAESIHSKQLTLETTKNISQVEVNYYCQRADYSLKLKEILEQKIENISAQQKKQKQTDKTLRDIFLELEMPLIEVLAKMELAGIKVNTMVLKGIAEKNEKRIKNLENSIYKLGGKEFNVNSPQQLSEILFSKLKLSSEDIKKTKTGFSTASSELEKLRAKHPIIEKIEEYRELFKLKTTYLDTLPKLVDAKKRIHTTFNQAVTATGRLSSSDPNLQNIPIRTDLGQLMRTAFVAEEGCKIISGDYSQIDLRVVAHMSADPKMMATFFRGDDIHKITASEINKVPLSQVTEAMRRAAKALNFGVIYGMSVFGFSQSAGVEREEAKKFIDAYMEKFQGVANYIRATKEFAKKFGYVETVLGRRRNIAEINSPNFQVAQAAERMAINMPIQGLSADIVKLAMVRIYEKYKNNEKVRMILQVHDEIILEVKEKEAELVAKEIKSIMENAYKLKVPLIASVKIGENWGEI